MWGYEGGFARAYDELVEGVVEELRVEYGARVLQGLMLKGVKTSDSIDHVAYSGMPLVLTQWDKWVRIAVRGPGDSVVPEVECRGAVCSRM